MTGVAIIFGAILLGTILNSIGGEIRHEVSRLADEVRELRKKL